MSVLTTTETAVIMQTVWIFTVATAARVWLDLLEMDLSAQVFLYL